MQERQLSLAQVQLAIRGEQRGAANRRHVDTSGASLQTASLADESEVYSIQSTHESPNIH